MLLFSGEFRYWLQMAMFAALALAAWRWGGGPERALAAVLVGMAAVDAGINHQLFSDPLHLEFGHFAIDLAAALIAIAVALFANRMYPLWFAALQILSVMAHLAQGLAHGIAKLAYVVMYTGPSYFQIFLLAGGIWAHRRRVLRFGSYRSWRSFSLLSPETPRRS
jgi:hypothetical protein